MIDREKVIEGLNNIKSIINAAVYYDDGYGSEQDLNCLDDAITLLEEQNNCENCAIAIEDRQLVVRCKDCKHLFNGEHNENCCDMLMEKCGWLKEISVSLDWFCANGERR